MDFLEAFGKLVPRDARAAIDWNAIEKLLRPTCFAEMKNTPQNPRYHGEGDVYVHTQRVCEELVALPGFAALSERQRTELFLAAVLHDIGKVGTTRLEDGDWVSPNHAPAGSLLARAFLWRDCGLSGTAEGLALRETVCALIRNHMLPVHLMDRNAPERKVREIAALGERLPDFSWRLLCLLAEADVRGRIAVDEAECLSQVELAGLLAEDCGCFDAPFPFADDYTKRACLSGRDVPPDQPLIDPTWGEVVLLSGLPGTGKDTWIQANCPDLPMVSLDALRRKMRVKPADNQSAVLQAAQEQARELLRKKQPFVWNATNLTKETRRKQIDRFERYGARVRVVYLETPWMERIRRNAGREGAVPEGAVERMLEKTVPPTPDEAQTVEWLCV